MLICLISVTLSHLLLKYVRALHTSVDKAGLDSIIDSDIPHVKVCCNPAGNRLELTSENKEAIRQTHTKLKCITGAASIIVMLDIYRHTSCVVTVSV
jgi:hypothetical protein